LKPSLKQSGRLDVGREETLSGRLRVGPLPLVFALRCATGVAAALRDMHLEGRAHGAVTPASILLRPSGAVLSPAGYRSDPAEPCADVAAFGAVLYEMLTGCQPPAGAGVPSGAPLGPATPRLPTPRTGPAALRSAAIRLAIRCLAASPDAMPAMQQVVTEVRLLCVMARLYEPKTPPPQLSPIPIARKTSAPAPQPLPVSAGQEVGNGPELLGSAPPADEPAPAPVAETSAAPSADESVPDPELSGKKCPKCGNAYVHESRPRSAAEKLLCQLQIPLRRCRRCHHRYIVFLGISFTKEMPL
jgi:hypothetical protein